METEINNLSEFFSMMANSARQSSKKAATAIYRERASAQAEAYEHAAKEVLSLLSSIK